MDRLTDRHNDLVQHGQIPQFTYSVTLQGQCVEVRCKNNILLQSRTIGRKAITKFSSQARMRMIRMCARIDWPHNLPAVFITLTTPDDAAECSAKERTAQRFEFQRQLEHWAGKELPILWRKEWVPRQSGEHKGKLVHHFHLIVCLISFIPHDKLCTWWNKAMKREGEVVIWIERIHSPLQVCHYLSEYLAKVPSLDYGAYLRKGESIGRQWGVMRKRHLSFGVKQKVFHLWEGDVEWLKTVGNQLIPEFGKNG